MNSRPSAATPDGDRANWRSGGPRPLPSLAALFQDATLDRHMSAWDYGPGSLEVAAVAWTPGFGARPGGIPPDEYCRPRAGSMPGQRIAPGAAAATEASLEVVVRSGAGEVRVGPRTSPVSTLDGDQRHWARRWFVDLSAGAQPAGRESWLGW